MVEPRYNQWVARDLIESATPVYCEMKRKEECVPVLQYMRAVNDAARAKTLQDRAERRFLWAAITAGALVSFALWRVGVWAVQFFSR